MKRKIKCMWNVLWNVTDNENITDILFYNIVNITYISWWIIIIS